MTGAGWVSVGPGYRHWLFGDRAVCRWVHRDFVADLQDGTGTVRIHQPGPQPSRPRFAGPVAGPDAGYLLRRRPRSLETDRSQYRLKSTDVVGYATVPPMPIAVHCRPRRMVAPADDLCRLPARSSAAIPSTQDVFPGRSGVRRRRAAQLRHGEASVTSTRAIHRSRPSRGGVYRAAWSGYSDQDDGPFSFRRYEAEGAHFVPLAGSRVVLARTDGSSRPTPTPTSDHSVLSAAEPGRQQHAARLHRLPVPRPQPARGERRSACRAVHARRCGRVRRRRQCRAAGVRS